MKTLKLIREIIFLFIVLVSIIMSLGFINSALAQHNEEEPVEHVFKNQRKNIVMLSFGYTYVPTGSALDHHEADGVFVPSVGLDYKRKINEKWALSLFTDWEFDHYIIGHKEIEREEAFIAVIGGTYELKEGFGLFFGAGGEFEQNRNLFVLRAGLEYGFELGHHWIMVPSVFYDWKESYDTYSFSLGISRKF